MINLLPADLKNDVSYARRNTRLRLWIMSCLVALVGIGLIVAGGLLYLQKSINDHEAQITQTRQNLQERNVDETRKRVEEISSNTKLATQVLSREILFSKLLRQIGSALPSNTVLKSLEIDQAQGGLELNAGATDFNAATQLQVNLQDPQNGVFEKSDINSINCDEKTAAQNGGMPCDVVLQALFSKNNSYFFLAPGGGNTGGAR